MNFSYSIFQIDRNIEVLVLASNYLQQIHSLFIGAVCFYDWSEGSKTILYDSQQSQIQR